MNIKKLFIGGIVGGIVYFILGWVVYGKLLEDYFKVHHIMAVGSDRNVLLFTYLGLGNLLAGFLLSYVFVKAKISSFGGGLVTGAVLGFLIVSSNDCIAYAVSKSMTRSGALADIIAFTIMSAIAGAIASVASGPADK